MPVVAVVVVSANDENDEALEEEKVL